MTPDVGTFSNPLVTWNLYLTLGGGVVLGLMIRFWFKDQNRKAEERLKDFSEKMEIILKQLSCDVDNKQAKDVCDLIHENEEVKHSELKCDIKEIKAQTNSILSHLTGIKHGV